MNTKIRNLLFEFSRNIRITTKKLGQAIKSSQQTSSYQINQLKKKKIIQGNTTIVDAVKLGFTHVLVGLNYLNFEPQKKKEVIDLLKATESVVAIEEAKQGADLIIEYSSANLSAFNKVHSDFMKKFHKSLETKFIFPIIVRHKYQKNYLTRKFDAKDTILCGDRKLYLISENELIVLKALVTNPDATFTSLAKTTGLSIKSIVLLKKKLEKRYIIKGYSCILNNSKLDINRSLFFLKFTGESIGEIDKLLQYCKYNKNITELIKIIGEYDIMLAIESLQNTDLLKELRSEFHIRDYLLVESENILKKNYMPI